MVASNTSPNTSSHNLGLFFFVLPSDSTNYLASRRGLYELDMDSLGDITTTAVNSQPHHRRTSVEIRTRYYDGLELGDENSPPRKMERHPRFMASTSASQAKTTPPQPQSRPITPALPHPDGTKHSPWISTVSRRVGNHSKTRKNRPSQPNSPRPGQMFPATTPRKQFKIHEDQMDLSPWPVPEPIRPIPARRSSPPNKPLPSLPIARLASDSPKHRRSLIDAEERILRRSVSPLPGVLTGEEWPVLNPSPVHRGRPTRPAEPIKSTGSSTAATQKLTTSSQTRKTELVSPHVEQSMSEAATLAMKSRSPPPSSLSVVRQTKTSLLRAELSGGHSEAHDEDKHQVSSFLRQHPIAHESNVDRSPADLTAPSLAGLTPTLSRSKRLITEAGSPFAHIRHSPSQARLIDIKKRRIPSDGNSSGLPSPTESDFSESGRLVVVPEAVAVKATRTQQNADRKSSLPLPTRLIRPLPEGDSESEVTIKKAVRKSVAESTLHNAHSDDGDIDTDYKAQNDEGHDTFSSDVPEPSSSGRAAASPDTPKTTPEICTTTESPEPGFVADDEASPEGNLMHDHRSFDSFRVKYLSVTSPEHGPTLRVSSAADRLIMGTGTTEPAAVPQEIARRVSVPDLRRSVVLKESIRKSIRGALPLSRSLTHRSLSRASQVVDDDAGDVLLMSTQSEAVSASGNHDTAGLQNDTGMASRDSFMSFIEHVDVSGQVSTRDRLANDHSDWPMKRINTLTTSDTEVFEKPVDNEDSWIPPLLVKPVINEPSTDKEMRPKSSMKVPNNTPTAVNPSPFTSNDWQRYSSSDVSKAADLPSVVPHSVKSSPLAASPRYALPTRNSSLRSGPEKFVTIKSPDRSAPLNTIKETRSAHHSISTATPAENTRPTPPGIDLIEALHTMQPEPEPFRSSKFIETPTPSPKILPPSTGPTPTPKTLLSNFRRILGRRSKDALYTSSRPAHHLGSKHHLRGSLAKPFTASSSPLSRENDSIASIPDSAEGISAVRAATDTAMRVMDLATNDTDVVKRDEMIDLARMLVGAISSAKDAEKAMEEARQAALKAERHALEAKRAVGVLAEMVGILIRPDG